MAKRTAVDHSKMRDMNLSLILNTLRTQAPLSRTDIARSTGLNKATVSSIIRDLLQNNLIQELETDNSLAEVGRPAINLGPNPEAGYIIGVEIGVDFISVIVTNFAIEVVSRRYESTARYFRREAMMDRLLFLVRESYEQMRRQGKLVFGVGVGVPGLVDISSGTLLFAPNLDWRDVPLRQILERELNAPVFVANEANLAALGESFFGAGVDTTFMLYVSFGVGIGGGIVLNGQLVEGATGFAGEVGHMTVAREGLPCNCGNHGCWETLASQRALYGRIRQAITNGDSTWLAETIGDRIDRLTVPLIVEAAEQGDAVARRALQETGEWMGVGVASLMNVINPQRVVVGGPLMLAHEFLMPTIKETVAARTWDWVREQANIVRADYSEDAAVMGGVAIIYRDVLNKPRRWLKDKSEA
jgi:glucokinase-like ROK family protein